MLLKGQKVHGALINHCVRKIVFFSWLLGGGGGGGGGGCVGPEMLS